MCQMTPRRHQWFLSTIGAVAILALFACGGSSPKAASQPGVFHRGDAGTVRVYPGSQATAPAKSSGDTLTQTFVVSANPADLGRFYTDSLSGWVPVQPIAKATASSPYSATWEHGSNRLQLTADDPPRETGDNPSVHYTLTLQD